MKLKLKWAMWITCIVFPTRLVFGYNGELKIINLNYASVYFTMTIAQQEPYAWKWIKQGQGEGIVIMEKPAYSRTFEQVSIVYLDAPKDINSGMDYVPWGLMRFTATYGQTTLHWTLDLRDEGWSQDTTRYEKPDTYIILDWGSERVYISENDSAGLPITGGTQEIWSYCGAGSPETQEFDYPVTLTNLISTQNAGGTLHLGGIPVSSGGDIYADSGSVVEAGTDNERFVDFQGSGFTYKHNNWNGSPSDYLLSRTVTVSTPLVRDANFLDLRQVRIQNQLLDAPSSGSDTVQLRDPWWLDPVSHNQPNQFRNLSAPLDSGLFLNQSGPNVNWAPPYYSIGAPLSQTIGGVESYFMEWTAHPDSASLRSPDKDTSAVLFKQAGATVTALYKGHLFSSGNALTNNNQRKVAVTSSGATCYAYGSVNGVWFTMVSGITVTPEFEVSAGSPGQVNSSPCIVAYGNIVNVVWQSMEWYGQGNEFNLCSILLRRYNATTGIWGSVEYVAAFSPPSDDYDATPVIDAYALFSTGHGDAKIVAWRDPDGIKVIAHIDEDWGTIGTVSGTNGYSLRPAIYDYNYVDYALVWEDSYASAIRYIELGYSDGNWHFLHARQVSPADWGSNTRPSLGFTYVGGAPTGYRPTVVWQSHQNISESGTSVHMRQLLNYGADNWSEQITSFTESEWTALSPSVGTLAGGSQFSVAWTNGTAVRKASWNGSSWSEPTTLFADGTQPAGTIRGETSVRIAAKKASGLIIDTSFSPSLGKIGSEASLTDSRLKYRLNRHALVDLGAAAGSKELFGGTLAFELAGMELTGDAGTQKLTLAPSVMASQLFTVQKDMSQLTVAGAIYGARLRVPPEVASLSAEPLARLVVRDLGSQSVACDLWTVPFSGLTSVADSSFGVFRQSRADLSDLAGREVSVEVEMLGKTRGANPIIVTDYLILKNQQGDLAKDGAEKEHSPLPTAYALHQNYPNPFNPVTTIAFDLPEAKHVRLILYNILGEEIQKVVDEDLPEGFHTRSIVAEGLPSGTYIYRITAGRYSESRKMVVLK